MRLIWVTFDFFMEFFTKQTNSLFKPIHCCFFYTPPFQLQASYSTDTRWSFIFEKDVDSQSTLFVCISVILFRSECFPLQILFHFNLNCNVVLWRPHWVFVHNFSVDLHPGLVPTSFAWKLLRDCMVALTWRKDAFGSKIKSIAAHSNLTAKVAWNWA